jgi:hypothetical protein
VPQVLRAVVADPELHRALGAWLSPGLNRYAPWLLHPLIRAGLAWHFRGVKTVDDFQPRLRVVLKRIIDRSIGELTVSGLDQLDPNQAYLFVSNHRDIVIDPALVNWTLYHAGFQTVRIAIGDNLLSKPYVSDLMRLNKSFIVKRAVKGMREKLKAAVQLSRYIHHCINVDKANVWIAQREGRAKNGYDKTNSAVIGMISLSKPKEQPYADYIRELNIVPVTLSYECDPLDLHKARELYAQAHKGGYKKRAHEDMLSIARGMTGWKGRVHLTYGEVLKGDYERDVDVAEAIDRQVHDHARVFGTHQWAYDALLSDNPELPAGDAESETLRQKVLQARETVRPYLLRQYANAVRMKQGEAPFD